MNAFSRTELLFGADAMERLAKARVAVFGVGGVGGYAVEALVRSGVGALDLVDDDTVCESNLNRQIIATRATIGMPKVDAAEERIRLLNPDCRVTKHQKFYLPETAGEFDFSQYDYVIDAIDTVSGKLGLAEQAYASGTPIISAMGAGNKLDPTAFEVADIMQTSVCPLAEKAWYSQTESGLFQGTAGCAAAAGKDRAGKACAGELCVRAVCGWADLSRRGHQGSDRFAGTFLMGKELLC